MRLTTSIFILLGVLSLAQAQDDTTPADTTGTPAQAEVMDGTDMSMRADSAMMTRKSTIHTGWAPFLGANAGYTGENTDQEVEGAPSSLKLLGSYATPSLSGIYDIGYGVQGQNFDDDGALDDTISTGALELAARYQFANRWQVGVVYNQLFDRGENYGANQADALFGGVQVMREFGMGDTYIGRVGIRAMSSINVESDPVGMGLIDFQLGWGGAVSRQTTASR